MTSLADRIAEAAVERPGDFPGNPAAAARLLRTKSETEVSGTPTLIRMSDVQPASVNWLWPGFLAKGKVHLVEGDPGTSKSTLALTLAAILSTGRPWPDGSSLPTGPGNALVLSAEDGVEDTIRPRLDAANADPSRVHVLTTITDSDKDGRRRGPRPPDLGTDLPHITKGVLKTDASLVIVDPLAAFMGTGVDAHRDQDVRRLLHPLAAMAEYTGTTVLCIRHLNKSGGRTAMYRGGGSIGIIGAARAAYLVAPDPDDCERRIMACTKINFAVIPPSLAYVLESDERHRCPRIVWQGPTRHTANDLLRDTDSDERSPRREAAEFLATVLADGPVPASAIHTRATAAGISKRTLMRAKHDLRIGSRKTGFGANGEYMWAMECHASPSDATETSGTP